MQRLLTNWAASTDVVLKNLPGTDQRGLSWLSGLLLETTPTTSGSVNFPEQDIVDAVSIGLPALYNPNAPSPVSAQDLNVYTAAKALVTGLDQAPEIAAFIWPGRTNDSTMLNVQSDITSSQLTGQFQLAVRGKIQRALDAIMYDVTSFVAFTKNGVFSGPNYLVFDASSARLDQGIRTYAISSLLAQKNYTGVFLAADNRTVTPLSNCSDNLSCFPTPATTVNLGEYTSNLSSVYNSPYSRASYELQAPSSPALIQVQPDWGDLELLMDGGLFCHSPGKDPSSIVTIRPNQGPDFNCVSRLDFCYSSKAGCPVLLRTGEANCSIPECASV